VEQGQRSVNSDPNFFAQFLWLKPGDKEGVWVRVRQFLSNISVQTHNNLIQGRNETINGGAVVLAPGQTLAHRSGADFADMSTREIHNFVQLGSALKTGVSFYLYNGPVPAATPVQLGLMGLGGGYCYIIDQATSVGMQIYYIRVRQHQEGFKEKSQLSSDVEGIFRST
jgi:hypothetical protein